MPIPGVDKVRNVIVVGRGKGEDFRVYENALPFLNNTRILYSDGQDVAGKLVAEAKQL